MRDMKEELKDMNKPKHAGGRPSVMTVECVNKLEQAFAIDATVEEACSYADISRETYYNWLEKHKEFSDRILKLRQRPVLKARQTVVQKLSENYTNAMDYLKRKRKNEFGDNSEVTIRTPKPLLDVLRNNGNEKNSGDGKED
jgi:hypothetical protein